MHPPRRTTEAEAEILVEAEVLIEAVIEAVIGIGPATKGRGRIYWVWIPKC
jgi:hypothetical protein